MKHDVPPGEALLACFRFVGAVEACTGTCTLHFYLGLYLEHLLLYELFGRLVYLERYFITL